MSDWRPLPRAFYLPSARTVAPRLLGHWLLRRTPEGLCGGPIVEVEAYLHAGDPACHAAAGCTARNRSMWGPPGHAYVYFIYGMHFCVNAVCMADGVAEAVLLRALEPAGGLELLRARRPGRPDAVLTNGPSKLCAALDIARPLDGVDLCDAASPLFIADHPDAARYRRRRGPVVRSGRIGIREAADLPLRFHLEGSPWVSRR